MKTEVCTRLGCEVPVFAFSHCRDVVAAVSRSGGFGVLGASTFSPEQLEQELTWLDENTRGLPYGVDMLFPTTYDERAEADPQHLASMIPEAHRQFLDGLLQDADVPALSDEERDRVREDLLRGRGGMTPAGARLLVEVAVQHPQVRLVVSALGVIPPDVLADLDARGIMTGAMVGKARHAEKQIAAGVELIVAQGTEAGGHTGDITTMVLVPEIIEVAAGRVPVLAAGGITHGRQIAAALAMGAQGVWLGTIWLGTRESELGDFERETLFAAGSDSTVRSRARTGKTVRMTRSRLSDAFDDPSSPGYLPTPLQGILFNDAHARVVRARRSDLYSFPVGQSVGALHRETTVAEEMTRLQEECIEAFESLVTLFEQE